jgi:hypothetical protein
MLREFTNVLAWSYKAFHLILLNTILKLTQLFP